VKVVIAAGGTGGHVFPALALADRLTSDHGADVRFIGSPNGQEATYIPRAGYAFHAVEALPFYREASWRAAKAPLVALRSMVRCAPWVKGADVAVGLGGYVSVPPMLAARRAHVRSVLHEPNAVPGLATRVLARSATAVAVAFEDARGRLPGHPRVEMTGYPIRDAIAEEPARREALAHEARAALDLDAKRRTVLVIGGSQGAKHLNEVVAGAAVLLEHRRDLQVVVLTGPKQEALPLPTGAGEDGLLVRTVPFLERIELAYAAADLVVARAGATTLAELAVCGIPSILVPYPHATENHQEANAREFERDGAAEVVLDGELTPGVFAERVSALLDDPARLERMAGRARARGKPDAAERFARLVVEVAKR
jgi:UDP-N-acetylglucosamine--N-acetylmuramyl-(pentapeptide) pyrophosphoryl-undecaprenol N-acetylglucosamine transferase